jgi:serine protease Do
MMALDLSGALATELAAVAERLREATVQVRGGARSASCGSGVVWRPGLVVTNAHVVTGRTATVETASGAVVDSQIVAHDPRRDLAVLRVAPELAPAAQVAGRAPHVGALVVAVGNPLGLHGAVTAGVVYGRVVPRRGLPLLLADLQLLPGNSGGPLADALGRVVGINTMMVRGLAAAIPSAAVERFLERAA